MDEKLLYLKEKFLSNFNVLMFENNSSINSTQFNAIKELTTNSMHFRQGVLEAKTKEELAEVMRDISTDYLIKWNNAFRQNSDSTTDLHSKFYDFYFDSGINNIDQWISNTEQLYDDKIKFDYFNKAKNFLGIGKTSQENLEIMVEKANALINSAELQELTKNLISKYNLCHIDLSKAKDVDTALKYLKNFDKSTQQMAQDMNMPNEYFGIKGTLSLSYNNTNEALYITEKKTISLDTNTTTKSTILHEWIHALDNYICKEHTAIDGFTSHMQNIIVKDVNTPISRAYHSMRTLTQDIFNGNEKEVADIVNKNMRAGLCKFWSVILDDQWYAISKEDREAFFAKDVQKVVLNYLANSNDPQHLSDLDWAIRKKGYYSSEQAQQKTVENLKYLQENVAPHFNKISENIIGKKSFYFHTANLSNLHVLTQVFIDKVTDTAKKYLNINENKSIPSNFQSGYYVEPCEMMARYFESQVYRGEALIFNITNVVGAYKINKDKDFEEKKDKLLATVFNKESTMHKIGSVRSQFHQTAISELKPT